jgi:hypothetical protein
MTATSTASTSPRSNKLRKSSRSRSPSNSLGQVSGQVP